MEIEPRDIMDILEHVPLFSHLGELDLSRWAGLFQVEHYKNGQVIFDFDDPAQAMYILYEGNVWLSLYDETEAESFAKLGKGDLFGEEALLFDDPRYYSAEAVGEATLLRLDIDHFAYLQDEYPGLLDKLDVLIRSRHLSTQVPLPWLQDDEYVHVITRRHTARLWQKMISPLIFLLAGTIVGLLFQYRWFPERVLGWIVLGFSGLLSIVWGIWAYFDWRNDYFIVTNKRVVWIEKVAFIYESRQEAPLRTIMSVGLNRSRIGSIFGFADVVVQTYVGTIRLRDLAHANAIGSMIEAYWHRAETFDRRQESQIMAEKLHEKLNLPWRHDEDTKPNKIESREREERLVSEATREPGFLTWLFSDFLRLRYEESGDITYRKHWFLLLKAIWLPSLLMVMTLGLVAARLGGVLSFLPITSTLVILLLAMFIFFIWILYQYADWRNDIFRITFDQILDIDRKPLGKERRRSAPLENVLSIEYERLGFWGFLLNFGTVYISVGNTRLTFDYVYNPSEVQQDIFYRMGERLDKIRQFEVDSERERVSEWIASYHRKTRQDDI
ncbi:MAG: cyclic nucleotide-binding domain-containing protein [Brevefilum sp.]|nr:cyclic nucleotide-binding domain-containing protein [Brevefilum sp.]MDT8381682.1 cyclic nucleotide-binding domain-containing protein [Brevefilum sp.]MDW7754752.1 cyclic nucleotide-binding domain-containing protein [Brevefilum sp.]